MESKRLGLCNKPIIAVSNHIKENMVIKRRNTNGY